MLEFACLYTHDIRRKQKRWKDGILRFHTFNKRIMVYDVPRNFIGDTHWKAEEAVQDGDEVTLEREGVLVQVAESVGRTETDLTELVGKRRGRKGGSSEVGSSSPVKGAQTPVVGRTGSTASGLQRQGTQLKHRSLNALLGTPKGPLGKAALPTKSPFEERHVGAENEQWEDGGPPKRRRVESAESWNVARTSKTPAKAQKEETPLWARTADAARRSKRKAAVPAGQQKLGTKEIIELSDDCEEPEKFLPGFSSDALAPPSSPPKEKSGSSKKQVPRPPARSSSPVFQTQRTETRHTKKAHDQPEASDEATTAKHHDGKAMVSIAHNDHEEQQPSRSKGPTVTGEPSNFSEADARRAPTTMADAARPSSSRSGQTLRMTARSSKKKTLLCQDQLTKKKPSRVHSSNTENAIGSLLDATLQETEGSKAEDMTQRRLLEKRLARIRTKSAPARKKSPDSVADMEAIAKAQEQTPRLPSEPPTRRPADEPTTLAELDHMIMPAAQSETQQKAPQPMPPPPKRGRQLRKAASDVPPSRPPKRAPGAPMRFTPSPSKRAQKDSEGPMHEMKQSPDEAPPGHQVRARQKKPIQRSVSLNTASNGTSQVIFSKPFKTPQTAAKVKEMAVQKDRKPDPWSREAFDLFSWRPPGWDEEGWCSTAAQG